MKSAVFSSKKEVVKVVEKEVPTPLITQSVIELFKPR